MDTTQAPRDISELLADLESADPADASAIADEITRRLGTVLDELTEAPS